MDLHIVVCTKRKTGLVSQIRSPSNVCMVRYTACNKQFSPLCVHAYAVHAVVFINTENFKNKDHTQINYEVHSYSFIKIICTIVHLTMWCGKEIHKILVLTLRKDTCKCLYYRTIQLI